MRHLIAIGVTAALAACSTTGVAPTAPGLPMAVVSAELNTAAAPVSIVEAAPSGALLIGKVEAFACQAHDFDPFPTDELATTMLRAEAAKRGARVIASVKLSRSNVDIARNCFTTIRATGTAYN